MKRNEGIALLALVLVSALFSGCLFLNYKVTLATPELSCDATTITSITLKWNSVPNAHQYELYRSTDESSWVCVAISLKEACFTDSKVTYGTPYYYRMCVSPAKNQEESFSTSAFSTVVKCSTKIDENMTLGTLSSFTAVLSATDTTKISLSWNMLDGVDHYVIKRKVKNSDDKAITISSSCTGTQYTDSTVTIPELYTYTVRGFDATGTKYTMEASVDCAGYFDGMLSLSAARKVTVGFPLSVKLSMLQYSTWLYFEPLSSLQKVSFTNGGTVYVQVYGPDEKQLTEQKVVCSEENHAVSLSGLTTGQKVFLMLEPMYDHTTNNQVVTVLVTGGK